MDRFSIELRLFSFWLSAVASAARLPRPVGLLTSLYWFRVSVLTEVCETGIVKRASTCPYLHSLNVTSDIPPQKEKKKASWGNGWPALSINKWQVLSISSIYRYMLSRPIHVRKVEHPQNISPASALKFAPDITGQLYKWPISPPYDSTSSYICTRKLICNNSAAGPAAIYFDGCHLSLSLKCPPLNQTTLIYIMAVGGWPVSVWWLLFPANHLRGVQQSALRHIIKVHTICISQLLISKIKRIEMLGDFW